MDSLDLKAWQRWREGRTRQRKRESEWEGMRQSGCVKGKRERDKLTTWHTLIVGVKIYLMTEAKGIKKGGSLCVCFFSRWRCLAALMCKHNTVHTRTHSWSGQCSFRARLEEHWPVTHMSNTSSRSQIPKKKEDRPILLHRWNAFCSFSLNMHT